MDTQVTETMEKQYLYNEVAERIESLVEGGTLRPGDRIPSIREYSKQAQVSINTVKVAYNHLEDRRVIEARPQSGYYVCPRRLDAIREPKITEVDINPLEITSSDLVVQLMQDVMDPAMVQFGAAVPDPTLIPSQQLARILGTQARLHHATSTAYEASIGNKRLRSQIARWMVKAGLTLHPEELIITSGASEAVFLALQTLCQPGDTVAVTSPIYFNFVQMFKLLHLRVIEIPNSPTEGIHLETLRKALATHTISCCLVISNFDNPLGGCLPDEKKRELVQLTSTLGVPLIEDDINGDLCHGDERPSVAKAWDKAGNVLLCSSFSKTIAPGYRVGWIAPGKYLNEVLHRKIVSNIATASPTQLAVADFLENGGYLRHLRRLRKEYATKLARMVEDISYFFPPGTRVTSPKGGFTLWLELPVEVDTVVLYAQATAKKITMAPGKLFSTREKYKNCLRLNSACWSEENRWAIQCLGELSVQLVEDRSIEVEKRPPD